MTAFSHPKIEEIPASSLKPNPDNARTHDARQIDQIAESIVRFGFLNPIIIDDDDFVVAGHGRLAAALKLGLAIVPVIRASFMSEADRRAFAIAENRIAELSEWDDKLLKSELEWLFEADYDLDVTGFELEDLDLGIELDEKEVDD